MSVDNRAVLKLELDAFLKANGNRAITGPIFNSFLTKVLESYSNRDDEKAFFGLLIYDPERGYKAKEGFMFGGQLWQANEAIPISTPDPTSLSTQKTGTETSQSYGFLPWDPGFNGGLGYPVDARVERGNRLWKSLSALNTTDPLTPAQTDWVEVSANDGGFGNVHVNGFYKTGQVITKPADPDKNVLFILVDPTDPFESSDLDDEIDADKWELFHDVSIGAPTGTPNRMAFFENITGNLTSSEVLRFDIATNEWQFLYDLKNVRVRDGLGIKFGDTIKLRHNAGTSEMFFDMSDKNIRFNASTGATFGELISNTNIVVELRKFILQNAGGFRAAIDGFLLTANRDHQLPDKDGIFAMLSDIAIPNNIITQQQESAVLSFVPVAGLNVITTLTVPIDGTYRFEWSCEIEHTGDVDVQFQALEIFDAGGTSASGFYIKRYTDTQGGAGGNLKRRSVEVRGINRSLLVNDEIDLQIVVNSGAPTIFRFIAHLIKVG